MPSFTGPSYVTPSSATHISPVPIIGDNYHPHRHHGLYCPMQCYHMQHPLSMALIVGNAHCSCPHYWRLQQHCWRHHFLRPLWWQSPIPSLAMPSSVIPVRDAPHLHDPLLVTLFISIYKTATSNNTGKNKRWTRWRWDKEKHGFDVIVGFCGLSLFCWKFVINSWCRGFSRSWQQSEVATLKSYYIF